MHATGDNAWASRVPLPAGWRQRHGMAENGGNLAYKGEITYVASNIGT